MAALLALALAAWQAVDAAADRRVARSPLPVGTVLGSTLHAILDSAGILSGGTTPVVLLYVSDACPHCQKELARWDSLATAGALPREGVSTVVIRLPTPGGRSPHLARFPDATIADPGGTIGRQLKIAVVPTAYWLDRDGRITEVTRGEQSPAAIRRRFQNLIRS
ncbi:MAG: TlpA family protein disulfide reductase [Gemmatimonadaceae bacterium]